MLRRDLLTPAAFLYSLFFLSSTAFCADPAAPAYDSSIFMASLRVLWGLLIVLGIIFAVYTLAKKKFNLLAGNTQSANIKIIETKHLMPKKSLHLIQVRDKEYLIGVTDHNITLLSSEPGREDFQNILDTAVTGAEEHAKQ